MQKGEKIKSGSLKGGKSLPSAKARPGTGARFKALESKLAKKGVKNPGGLAAALGRAKYGSTKMAKMAAAGRKKGGK